MKDFDYPHWLSLATRYSRRRAESADLLHDAILDAIRADRIDFSKEDNRRWFVGVVRNRAAMAARTAHRRGRRELAASEETASPHDNAVPGEMFIDSLPPSARSVATLIAAGLNRTEIISALRIAPTAFRQRLTSIRRAWNKVPAEQRELIAVADASLPNFGLMRRALLSQVRRVGGVGTHDPDGHLLVFQDDRSQSSRRRQLKKKEQR